MMACAVASFHMRLAPLDPGGLLRHLDPTLLPAAIKAAKEGAGSDFIPGLYRSQPEDAPLMGEEDSGEEEEEEEEVRTAWTERERVHFWRACGL